MKRTRLERFSSVQRSNGFRGGVDAIACSAVKFKFTWTPCFRPISTTSSMCFNSSSQLEPILGVRPTEVNIAAARSRSQLRDPLNIRFRKGGLPPPRLVNFSSRLNPRHLGRCEAVGSLNCGSTDRAAARTEGDGDAGARGRGGRAELEELTAVRKELRAKGWGAFMLGEVMPEARQREQG